MSFSPKDISSLAIWMDASDLSSMDLSNSTVTQWRDKSGKNNVTSTSIGTPTLISSGVNSKNVIRTNTSGYFYMDPLTNPANTTTVSAFAVATMTNNPSSLYSRLISLGKQSDGTNDLDYSTTPNFIFCRDNLNPIVSIYRNSSTQSTSITYDSPFLMDCVFDGTTCNGFLNGTNFANFASSGTFSFNRMGLGVNIDTKTTASGWSGYICEVLIFYGALTSGQRQQVEGYLANKWGLVSSLPASHPYASASAALTNYSTNPSTISNYVMTSTDTPANLLLSLKASIKSNNTLTAVDKANIQKQYISSLMSKNGSSTFSVSNSTTFFTNSNSVQPGLSTKNVKVILPDTTANTIDFPTSTTTNNYYHMELPLNTPVTVSNITPTVTLLYNGTNITYNGQSKALGDTLTINSKTYKIVALGSITLDEQSGGVGGDPHIYPLLGEPYDLPNVKRRFLLFNNVRPDNVKVVCECDFLTKQEIADSKYVNKSVSDGTYMTKLWIYHNEDELLVDLKNLSVIEKDGEFNLTEIYSNNDVFRKFYANMFIYKNNIEFNGKSRNIKIKTDYGTYEVKLSLDLNCADLRNHVEIFGPDLLSCKGALISKNRY